MPRPTITKYFKLSPAAVAELERRVAESGAASQTAYVEAWLRTGIKLPPLPGATHWTVHHSPAKKSTEVRKRK